ncbi:MAG: HNH endonuclease [Bacteroidales bacterium]|nr:HNH endonuclease [Bacteroidales bacterium]
MNRKDYLDKIIHDFEDWWSNDSHRLYVDFYKDTITYINLNSLSKNDFIDFFYDFVSKGGHIQSGGDRAKNKFRDLATKDFNNLKSFVLEPFTDKFSLEDWFHRLDAFPGFGVGIATIYLNRIDYSQYPIMNNKTLNALNKLGYKISSSKSWKNYELVKNIQENLIKDYSNLNNYYKADSLNHFLVAVYPGKALIYNYQQIETFENILEQTEIEHQKENNSNDYDKKDLLNRIINCENDKSEKIILNGKTFKRYNYLMVQIKKYRDYRCQFCSTKIPKASGDFYIEACHINAKSKRGKDTLDNILILCPNCHKLFDFNERINEKITKDKYSVILNGNKYTASLK